MIATSILSAALTVASLAGAPPTNGDLIARVAMRGPIACFSGYHQDAQGNCQPNIPQTPTYCASLPGTVYQPAPWGWDCVPVAKGY